SLRKVRIRQAALPSAALNAMAEYDKWNALSGKRSRRRLVHQKDVSATFQRSVISQCAINKPCGMRQRPDLRRSDMQEFVAPSLNRLAPMSCDPAHARVRTNLHVGDVYDKLPL